MDFPFLLFEGETSEWVKKTLFCNKEHFLFSVDILESLSS